MVWVCGGLKKKLLSDHQIRSSTPWHFACFPFLSPHYPLISRGRNLCTYVNHIPLLANPVETTLSEAHLLATPVTYIAEYDAQNLPCPESSGHGTRACHLFNTFNEQIKIAGPSCFIYLSLFAVVGRLPTYQSRNSPTHSPVTAARGRWPRRQLFRLQTMP